MAFIALETAHAVLFYQVSTCSCTFAFCYFDAFFLWFFKTCSKLRLKLHLLRDRCRDEVPVIRAVHVCLLANRRSSRIGSSRTGIHVITEWSNYTFGTGTGFLLAKALGGSLGRKWLSLFRAKLVNQSVIISPDTAAQDCGWLPREHMGCLQLAETHFWVDLSWNHRILGGNELKWLARKGNSITRCFSGLVAMLQNEKRCSQKKL